MTEHHNRDKKVEYVELIYDLIFVYVIGRNNSLLQDFRGGFVAYESFMAYVMCTLAIIQIWNYTTYYINVHGENSARDHVFMFVNMFLMYFIGEATRTDWHGFHTQYHLAWALILSNIGLQYLLEMRHHVGPARAQSRHMAAILFSEAALVVISDLLYDRFHIVWPSLAAILLGMAAVVLFGQRQSRGFVDFAHLSERAMLYVVFTFGEMIIGLADYFEGAFSWRSTYFALMAFLIVVGLFLSYGVFYDHIIDREMNTNGLSYMFMHIFIIFAMNNITNGLIFMRVSEVELWPKLSFLVTSFLLFFAFLFALGRRHARARCQRYPRLALRAGILGGAFVALMVLFRDDMALNIALSAAFVFAIYAMICAYGRRIEAFDHK